MGQDGLGRDLVTTIKRTQIPLPSLLYSKEGFISNLKTYLLKCSQFKMNFRVATKSLRSPTLIKMVLDHPLNKKPGLMCFSIEEANYWWDQGIGDILVAYPLGTKAEAHLTFLLAQKNPDLKIMVDHPKHLQFLTECFEELCRQSPEFENCKLSLCLDIDMSLRMGGIHFGVQRSSIRTIHHFQNMLQLIKNSKIFKLWGMMGYEAQVAGLPDRSPFNSWQNPIKQLIRSLSKRHILHWRAQIVEEAKRQGFTNFHFNGGGSGCFEFSGRDPSLTELTAGSGLVQSQLFDFYSEELTARLMPAIFIALPVSRFPEKDVYTLKSGGFAASGEAGPDRLPRFFYGGYQSKANLFGGEGLGEVQSPISIKNTDLKVGEPILFRPAKAGEITEHFNHAYLITKGEVEKVSTYRGMGLNFF